MYHHLYILCCYSGFPDGADHCSPAGPFAIEPFAGRTIDHPLLQAEWAVRHADMTEMRVGIGARAIEVTMGVIGSSPLMQFLQGRRNSLGFIPTGKVVGSLSILFSIID